MRPSWGHTWVRSARQKVFAAICVGVVLLLAPEGGRLLSAAEPSLGKARLTIVFILDGLRPDSINPTDTPNLYRLRQEGVNYLNGHAVFPTVTRVNAPGIATGAYPRANGMVSNAMYVPAVDPTEAFDTGDFQNLLKLDEVSGGCLLFVKSLGELLQAAGRSLAAVSSGSTGSALLLNHRAPQGVGTLINGYFEPGVRVAYPDDVNTEVLARFGPAPTGSGSERVNWAEEVLREYVLPELTPTVVLNWLTEPDGTQHALGAGSPEAVEAIRNDDRNIGLILDQLAALGLAEFTDIFVVSDHGFGLHTFAVNVAQTLIGAGLKAGPDSDDVVLASSGQAVLLHVKNHDEQRIRAVAEFLQAQEWAGVLFTEPRHPDREHDPHGWVPGTFSLKLIHVSNPERGPDILLTFPWTSGKNEFGVQGTDFTNTGGTTGPITTNSSGHGSMSPWAVRNTFFAWGVDFKNGVTVRVPASNVDVTPTILALLGVADPEVREGRVLVEALKGGPDEETIPVRTRVFVTETPDYAASIQVSIVEGHPPYIDKSWRTR